MEEYVFGFWNEEMGCPVWAIAMDDGQQPPIVRRFSKSETDKMIASGEVFGRYECAKDAVAHWLHMPSDLIAIEVEEVERMNGGKFRIMSKDMLN